MKTFAASDLKVAVALANNRPFPLHEAVEVVEVLNDASAPALRDLPPHHDCDVVKIALQTMFVMGVSAGIELERGS